MTAYEFKLDGLCKEHTNKELAELCIGYEKAYDAIKQDNDVLRKENETLRYLIAKHWIEKENEHESNIEIVDGLRSLYPLQDFEETAVMEVVGELNAYRAIGTVEELNVLKECIDYSATVKWLDKNRISVNNMEFVRA